MRSSSSSNSAGSAPRRRPMSDLIGASDDLSRYSVAITTVSSDRSSGSGRGAAAFLDAFRSCFAPSDARSPETSLSDVDFDASHQHSQSLSSQGSTSGSTFESRRSARGLYGSTLRNSSEREVPGDRKFTLPEIQKATKNFSPNLKIGQGGSGTVYKGQLSDGTLVAVKRAKKNMYDKHMGHEFRNEIEMLRCIEHLNLVRFHGFLEFGGEQLIIVEYVPNGNLREHLEGLNGKVLEFSVRLEIAIDVAHAITYLHTYSDQPVIHRDIKSSNILLTNNCRAKVADFGFAKLAPTDATHVSTQVKGTAGYLDPEYLRTYQLTEKSDVYSFGVLLVELVTGRRPIEPKRAIGERVTAKWAMEKFSKGDAILTLDPNLEVNDATNLAIEKMYELALQCLAPKKRSRPSMRRCAEILWSIRKDYRELAQPTSS
ncbi:calmodulin-binding receptor-like cytoplasmic kinase 2 [Triticum dicoccoides]|uniref:calmodulin-binding receptor-like cytoplasmic kinase 2 n=1 Tax=Triticum dicoccoides TaxID=85692 RepID=UPI0018900CB9|nr:calmodulin-binding receptor-like cytoplasmic kinase 2 [Triticum dicoccoides]